MDKQELAQLLMAAFLEELDEHVEAINRDLLALEKKPTGDHRQLLLKELFRAAHTLKGAAAANNIQPIEQFCHRLEDILVAVRDGQREFSDDLFALCFRAADALEEAAARLREEDHLDNSPLVKLLPEIERAAENADCPALDQPPSPTPVTSDVPASVPPAEPEQPSTVAASGPSSPHSSPLPATDTAVSAGPAVLKTDSQPVTSGPADRSDAADVSPAATEPAAVRMSPEKPTERNTASVRVAAEKLDTLLAQTGELLVARRRVESRLEQIQELRDYTAEWSAAWRMVEKPIRQLIEPDRTASQAVSGRPSPLQRRAAAVLQQTGERIRQIERRFEQLEAVVRDDGRVLAQTCDALDDEVNRVRMLPFSGACAGLERVVRDVARTTGKQVALTIQGSEVEVDRAVVEELKGPLLHLVRNAIDHGIEMPEVRAASGKPAVASVRISAAIRGAMVEVVIADDGQGFDVDRIREIAGQRGLTIPPSDRDVVRLIFQAGFSTARSVTDISGRGVGLDVVQSKIESLHGTVDVEFTPGQGSQFSMQVPLTLTTIRAVLVRVENDTYVIPTASVQRILRFNVAAVEMVAGRSCLISDEPPVPISFLSEFVRNRSMPHFGTGLRLGVELSSSRNRVVFVVDEVIAEQDVVVKSLGHRIHRVPHVAGATLLPSGRVALLVNVANLLRSAVGQNSVGISLVPTTEESGRVRRVLVAEDSLTTRTLMKSILETAGYEILTAADGRQAWEMLERESVDLVLSDVDMPRMDGFQLTETLRNAVRFSSLPVILVTARHSDEDKARGAAVGANAYVVKSAFDQRTLLETIGQLL